MIRQLIVEKLIERGYNAQPKNVTKNGVELEGIVITAPGARVAPIIYTESAERMAEDGLSIDRIVDHLIETYEGAKESGIDAENFEDKDFILNNVYIAMQRCSNEDISKKTYKELDGIEGYLVVKFYTEDNVMNAKLTDKLLAGVGITIEEAWEKAMENTINESVAIPIEQIVCEMQGVLYDADEELSGICVLTNIERTRGAAAILNRELVKKVADEAGVNRVVVIPSSIHEFLITPYRDENDVDMATRICREVNAESVDPVEQLGDRAYVLEV